MAELYGVVTSGFWPFVGSIVFTSVFLGMSGWALNALCIGLRGTKCDNPFG